MNATTATAHSATDEQSTSEVLLVPASAIARRLSVSIRYVHLLAEQGKIPVCRFGKGCVRFNPNEVLAALGIGKESKP